MKAGLGLYYQNVRNRREKKTWVIEVQVVPRSQANAILMKLIRCYKPPLHPRHPHWKAFTGPRMHLDGP
jgi:hypothetical protein